MIAAVVCCTRKNAAASASVWCEIRRLSMCDYSLHGVASRPTRVGDRLISTNFHNSVTRGFASAEEPNVAVCLLPGSELAFESDVQCDPAIPFLPYKKIGHRVARFRQVNLNNPATHHDALEFPSGETVLVNNLAKGQCVTVLQLPATAHPETRAHTEVQRPQPVLIETG
jgi:hypothetical protein